MGGPEQLVLRDGDSMDAVESDAVVDMKDLGPQIGYRTVFLVEYGGPLLIHLFFYLYAAPLYRMLGFLGPDEAAPEMSLVQKAGVLRRVSLRQARAGDGVYPPVLERDHAHFQHLP